jgi:uncharacterized membrane protein YozB (DUF420 family)
MASLAPATVDKGVEHKFYSRMALLFAALVLVGFTPSFYSFQTVSWPRPNPPLTALTITHGLVFTAWMVMVVVQTQMIAAGRRDLHMQLGVAGFALAATMPVLMYFTGIHGIPRGFHPPIATGEMWAALPLLDIPPFVLLIAMGWIYRREPQVHKRLMLIAGARMIEPALGRMPFGPPTIEVNYFEALLTLLISVGPLAWWDLRQIGKIHWVTQLGAVLISLTFLLRFAIWGTQGWHDFAASLPG